MVLLEQLRVNMTRGPDFEAGEHDLTVLCPHYLPQFHPIAKNDGCAYLRETPRVLSRLARPGLRSVGSEKSLPATPPRAINGMIRAVRRRGANATEALADALRPD